MSGRRERARDAARRTFPFGTTRGDVARVGGRAARDLWLHAEELKQIWSRVRPRATGTYARWLHDHRSTPSDLVAQRAIASDEARAPDVDVDVVILASPGQEAALRATVGTLQSQSDHRWEAVVLGGAAPSGADPRITQDDRGRALLEVLADGPARAVVLVLEAGDLCEPDLVFRLAAEVWEAPSAQLVHWDDDVRQPDGTVAEPRFRPSWSPETLLSANYLGRSWAVRRGAVAAAATNATASLDETWWDLLLGLDLSADEVRRLPHVLTHLVRRPDPLAGGAATVRPHVTRHEKDAEVVDGDGAVVVRRWPGTWPTVDICIPTRHNRALVEQCLRSLAASEYDAGRLGIRIIDNGERTDANESWYVEVSARLGLPVEVTWWDEPFNYSRVNNVVASASAAEVLVFMNDDTVAVDPTWLREVVSWAVRPDIGLVGLQLIDPDGLIQHGGVIIGLGGFADHLFQGMRPGDDSLLGSTRWYRNALSVTAACVTVRRATFEQVGGFDERFALCGSDVVLGLDADFLGLRNVVLPNVEVRHLESATRGTNVPEGDFFASVWRYQKHLIGGDRFYSPNLSMASRTPALRPLAEPAAMQGVAQHIGRPYQVFRQSTDEDEIRWLSSICRADSKLRPSVERQHAEVAAPTAVRTVNWFLPDLDSPFYGGVNTAFRIADQLAADHGVQNQFVLMAGQNEPFFDSALAAAYPRLAGSTLAFYDGSYESMEANAPDADVSIASLWVTAYAVARFTRTRRRAYLIQDYEPMFYPAGSMYAMTEETYRLGLYGLCNTERLRDIYTSRYGGTGFSFMPAVQTDVFHAEARRPLDHPGPVRVFLYARPGHWRNCWELAGPALDIVKSTFGQDVEIVTAGSWARPEDLGRGIQHLGLLDYRDTGSLYRTCDLGIALTLSEHPSYLPLELLACGTPVVAFDNPAGDWILEHEENCIRTPRTVDGLAEGISRLVADADLRTVLSRHGLEDIAKRHGSWPDALAGIYEFLCDPEGFGGR